MRPTTMRALRALLCTMAFGLGLAACDSGSEGQLPESTRPADAVLFAGCRANDPALQESRMVWEVDLDGDGTANEVAYVPGAADGPCADSFFTTIHGAPYGLSLVGADLEPDSVRVLQLHDTDRQLLLGKGGFHPRGGFELHLFGYGPEGVGEVLTDGKPVVGFVATDGGAAPATATCTDDGGVATLTASPHQPPGVMLAWDLTRTTYRLRGNVAEKTSTEAVKEAAPDPILRNEAPELFAADSWFSDCIVGDASR